MSSENKENFNSKNNNNELNINIDNSSVKPL